jgi:hypothetical protein
MRIDFGDDADGAPLQRRSGRRKVQRMRKLLDRAIASVKGIIGSVDRPLP